MELPLSPLDARLPLGQPFTPTMARGVGVPRSHLDRMLRDGVIRRLLRGVYVDATVPDSLAVRAAGLGLVMPPGSVAVDRTAAWLHGVNLLRPNAEVLPPVEMVGRTSCGRARHFGGERAFVGSDLVRLHGVTATTALRTAADLGRLLPPDRAIAALDAFLHLESFTQRQLLGELDRFRNQRGVRQLRELASMADGRAHDAAESVLRLRWFEANLPTPIPRLPIATPTGWTEPVLALEVQRFAAAFPGQLLDEPWLRAQGWRIVVLSRERVLGSDAYLVMRHLEREFHQQLLRQIS